MQHEYSVDELYAHIAPSCGGFTLAIGREIPGQASHGGTIPVGLFRSVAEAAANAAARGVPPERIAASSLEDEIRAGRTPADLGWDFDHTGPNAREWPVTADIGVVRVATAGCGNMGRLVWVGLTQAGRAVVRAGRVAQLISAGCPAEVAVIAASAKYGMEEAVWHLASDVLAVVRRCPNMVAPKSRREWRERVGWEPMCSIPRAAMAWEIAAKAR